MKLIFHQNNLTLISYSISDLQNVCQSFTLGVDLADVKKDALLDRVISICYYENNHFLLKIKIL